MIEKRMEQLEKVREGARIYFTHSERFFYGIDTRLHVIEYPGYRRLGNLTINYSMLLEKGLDRIEKIIDQKLKNKDDHYLKCLKRSIETLKFYRSRCIKEEPYYGNYDKSKGAYKRIHTFIIQILQIQKQCPPRRHWTGYIPWWLI